MLHVDADSTWRQPPWKSSNAFRNFRWAQLTLLLDIASHKLLL